LRSAADLLEDKTSRLSIPASTHALAREMEAIDVINDPAIAPLTEYRACQQKKQLPGHRNDKGANQAGFQRSKDSRQSRDGMVDLLATMTTTMPSTTTAATTTRILYQCKSPDSVVDYGCWAPLQMDQSAHAITAASAPWPHGLEAFAGLSPPRREYDDPAYTHSVSPTDDWVPDEELVPFMVLPPVNLFGESSGFESEEASSCIHEVDHDLPTVAAAVLAMYQETEDPWSPAFFGSPHEMVHAMGPLDQAPAHGAPLPYESEMTKYVVACALILILICFSRLGCAKRILALWSKVRWQQVSRQKERISDWTARRPRNWPSLGLPHCRDRITVWMEHQRGRI
jgi:hypothetical protein